MQNRLHLFTRGFWLHFQACFNRVYLDYIICENAFFYSEFGNIVTILILN